MVRKSDIRQALRDADESLTPHYRDDSRASARVLADAVHELTEALEDAVTGCSNPRQPPGAVLAKYMEAADNYDDVSTARDSSNPDSTTGT